MEVRVLFSAQKKAAIAVFLCEEDSNLGRGRGTEVPRVGEQSSASWRSSLRTRVLKTQTELVEGE